MRPDLVKLAKELGLKKVCDWRYCIVIEENDGRKEIKEVYVS